MAPTAEEFKARMQAGREAAAAKRAEEAEGGGAATATATLGRATRPIDNRDRFRARRSGSVTTEEDTEVPEGMEDTGIRGGPGSYTAPPLVRMYAPNRFGFYDARDVPDGSVEACFAAGFLEDCPDCHTNTCNAGLGGQCPARPARAYRLCPVLSCRKPVYDEPQMVADVVEGETEDPNLIRDDAFAPSTPETRTRAMLDNHMLWYHEQESIALAPHLIPLIQGKQALAKAAG